MLQQDGFCNINNARAWLFHVARNAVIDCYRVRKDHVSLPDDIAPDDELGAAVDDLSQCLPRVLSELSPVDREAITLCDLNGISQQRYADLKGITLAAAKSRVQRARNRLKNQLETACRVKRDAAGHVSDFTPRPLLR